MNLLIVTPIFPPSVGGPATYSKEIAIRLKARGHGVRIVTFGEADTEQLHGIPLLTVSPRLPFISRQLTLLRALIRESRHSDVIYAQDPLVCGLACRVASLLTGKPYFCKFVGDVVWEGLYQEGYSKDLEEFLKNSKKSLKTGTKFRIEKSTLKNASRVVTPSKFLKRLLIRYYGVSESRVVVIPNSVDISFEKKERNRYEIVVIGRVVKTKRIDAILEALALLTTKYPQVRMKIVGTGPEVEALSSVAQTMGLGSKVTFVGSVENTEVIKIMEQSGMLIVNSSYEGLSHTILEAMACKLPVIASNIEPNSDLITDHENGLLVENTPISISNAIIELLDNPGLAESIAEEGYKAIMENYTFDINMESLDRMLTSRSHATREEVPSELHARADAENYV